MSAGKGDVVFERRWFLIVLSVGAVLICAWCSLISGVGGFMIGGDLAARGERLNAQATQAASSPLPPLGVLVIRTERGGPAALAGVDRGDVITALNGMPVQDARDLRALLNTMPPNTAVRVTIDRNGNTMEVQIQLGSFPGDGQRAYLGIYYTARAEEPADL